MFVSKYFPGFTRQFIPTDDGVSIHTLVGGQGEEAVLLLHGHPENYLIWRFLAPVLAKDYTVVVTDLRGYGESSKPEGLADHSNYAKRIMARDQVRVMEALGFSTFHLIGHDRGARVCHRLALDYPEMLKSLCMMDILPTDDMYDDTNATFAMKYWHWFFYTQPKGFPERLMAADPSYFIEFNLNKKIGPTARGNFPDDVLAEFTRHFANPATIHGICEDYRASATIDRVHNDADRDVEIQTPTLVLWGGNGVVGQLWDVLAGWKRTCSDVMGHGIENCGHFVPEEQPQAVEDAVLPFLRQHSQQ